VRGLRPPNKPTRGRVFLLAGAAKFIRLPPGLQNPRGRGCLQVGSATQISNFPEIEFTRLTPLLNFCGTHKFKSLKPRAPCMPHFSLKLDKATSHQLRRRPNLLIILLIMIGSAGLHSSKKAFRASAVFCGRKPCLFFLIILKKARSAERHSFPPLLPVTLPYMHKKTSHVSAAIAEGEFNKIKDSRNRDGTIFFISVTIAIFGNA